MSWFAISAGFLALGFVLFVQRRAGHRMAGFCVCLPLTSGPLALSLYIANGAQAAQLAATGSIEAIGAAAVSVTVFGLLRHSPLWVSLPASLSAFVAVVYLKTLLVSSLLQSVVMTSCLIALCAAIASKYLHEHANPLPAKARDWRLDFLAPFVLLAFGLLIAPMISARWSGVLSSAPILALSFLVSLRLGNGSAFGIAHAVQGGFDGMAAKLGFFVALLALLDFQGHGWMAFGFGALICFAASASMWLRRRAPAQPRMIVASALPARTQVV